MEREAFSVALRSAAALVAGCSDDAIQAAGVLLPASDPRLMEDGAVAARTLAAQVGLSVTLEPTEAGLCVRFWRSVAVEPAVRPDLGRDTTISRVRSA